jgi:hypothetical protein
MDQPHSTSTISIVKVPPQAHSMHQVINELLVAEGPVCEERVGVGHMQRIDRKMDG